MSKPLSIIILFICAALALIAQPKKLQAVKLRSPLHIDGLLDEADWKTAPEATGFITNGPAFGKTPSVRTVVKLLYDDNAIYIGAYLYDTPEHVRKQFTPRDNAIRSDVDFFAVFIDTYHDRQNAYQFQVTTRNVQTDSRVSPGTPTGFGGYGDMSWDAVWESKVVIQKDGWSVEMRIPYFSLRFAKTGVGEWGINFMSFSRQNNETAFWNPVNPNEDGFVNQFGDLGGLDNIRPPLRLSFSPYVSGGYRGNPQAKGGYQNQWLKSGGLDVKYGINESFTLDATLIPDFGQVISDNVINNITPFEQQFTENRPFFTEGTELFNKAGIFYSRRVGRTPSGYYAVKAFTDTANSYTIVNNPDVIKLYNAIKLSGRIKDNLGIGVFNAVTEPVRATIRNLQTGKDSTVTTENLTNYNVVVLDKVLKNRSYITFTNTNVMRNGTAGDANVTALDIALYNKRNTYAFYLQPRYSRIFGNGGYEGYKNATQFGKVSGTWQWFINNNIVSDTYNPNDLGFQLSPNAFSTQGQVSYNIYQPYKNFLNQHYLFTVLQSYLYKPFSYQKTEFKPAVTWIFTNFWDLELSAPVAPIWFNDYFELQTPGKMLKRFPYYSVFASGSSDSRKKLYAGWNLGFAEGPYFNDPYNLVTIEARYRFGDRFTMNISLRRQHDQRQWGLTNNGRKFIFDKSGEPVLARRRFTDVTTILTGTYNFTSRMNLSFRARHYWNRLLNTNLYHVNADGYWTERYDLVPSDYNANYNIFNLDVFYTWDFRLGSRVIIGYKNWLGNDYLNALDGRTNGYYGKNLVHQFSVPHGNEFTLRFIYFLNYTDLAGKKNHQ